MSEGHHHIDMYKLVGFGEEYFRTSKKSFLSKKKFATKILLEWQNHDLKVALLKTTSNSLGKTIFRSILGFMGDRYLLPNENPIDLAVSIVSYGIKAETIHLRDEVYCQICKQVTFNPSHEHTYEGWLLMKIVVNYFPPSRTLYPYVIDFISEHLLLDKELNGNIADLAKYCLKMLDKISEVGARGRLPTYDEIEGLYNAPLISIFGSKLEEVMEIQSTFTDEPLPLVLTSLALKVLELDGQHTEGIFRIPGDSEQVATLKVAIENGVYDFDHLLDAHVPASTLKLWMREMEEPIIPGIFYDEAIKYAKEDDHKGSCKLVQKIPRLNRLVTEYVIQYLRILSQEEFVSYVK
eukprot:TRINITY_DN3916_c0_g1_i1.p1 TRINITY_DN3916_c0_g1~~TRINITY_DN3916_c0_g1_i1.p1  ORF type:complete len:360 (-),score=68.13 TRINITY_DN3916_c0_g1_i1:269-1321(-)